MSAIQQQVDRLVQRFEQIARERMQGLPFYNGALQVEAIGFREVEQGYLGALITPWFINTILLFDPAPRSPSQPGHRCTHSLPGGDHDFMIGEDEELGRYDFISLASPTTRYKSQQQARDLAHRKLSPLFGLEEDDRYEEKPVRFVDQSHHTMSRRRFFMGPPATADEGGSE